MTPTPDDRRSLDEALFADFAPVLMADAAVECGPAVVHSLDAPPPVQNEVEPSYYLPVEPPHEVEASAEPEPEPPIEFTLDTLAPLALTAGTAVTVSRDYLRVTGAAPHLVALMILSPVEHGTLLRDGCALTGGDEFTQEDINRGKVRYRHDGGAGERDSFTFATSEGELPATVFSFTIQPVHHAPELLGPGQLDGITEGRAVADLLAGMASSVEADADLGIALVAINGRGTWYHSGDAMRTWMEVGDVQHGRALLLGSDAVIRFEPRPGWSGVIRLTYRAWDGWSGQTGETIDLSRRDAVGGSQPFSKTTASALLSWSPSLPETPSCGPWEGTPTLAELFGDGLAVVRLDGPGQWQFSLDDGGTWQPFGNVYHGRARLLRASDRVRFVPSGGPGKVVIGGRIWDGRGAPGGLAALASASTHGAGTPFGEFVQTRTWWLAEAEAG